ncbi:hypothetical protein [Micromonospora chersina]|uniref:hypothetical protein n=1 Tax=Micromonospora chersina TaxID=47854 RepID=UPI00369101EC
MHELFLPLALYVRPSGTPDQPDDSNKILHFRSVSDSAPAAHRPVDLSAGAQRRVTRALVEIGQSTFLGRPPTVIRRSVTIGSSGDLFPAGKVVQASVSA